MTSVYFQDRLQVCDRPVPVPGPGEARIRVRTAGICNTDLELVRGYMGFSGILGHEFVGTVDVCENPAWIGVRVVGEINLGCNSCPECARGLSRHCAGRTVLGILKKDGVMAEYVTLPLENLHRVPEGMADARAVFTEPLAAALEIAEQIHLRPGQRALVIGDGKLGLLIVQVLHQLGCEVTLLGRHGNKLALAERWGISSCSDADTLEGQFPLVVDATGAHRSFALAVAKTQPRGTLVLKSTYANELQYNPAPIVINEITVVGSRCGPFAPALALLETGAVDTDALISATFPLADAEAAFRAAEAPEKLKVLLDAG